MLDSKQKVNMALKRQEGIRRRTVAAKPIPEIDGISTLRIDPKLFHHAAQLHPDKNGQPDYSVCADSGYWRDMKKRIPTLDIPVARSTRCVITMPALPPGFWDRKPATGRN